MAPLNPPRLRLRVAGLVWSDWLKVEITRDLGDLAGTVQLSAYDTGRVSRLGGLRDVANAIDAGHELRIEDEGELIFVGYVDEPETSWDANSISMDAVARDRTGDLVDCTAAPDGPSEYRGLKLDELARRLCAPFGITVRADVDVGAPFPKFSLDADDLVFEAIEKAARQRAVLCVSDGVGGLLLTRGGSSRAPADLALPGNVQRGGFQRSHADRFSRYIVKGQSAKTKKGAAAQSSRAEPLTPDAPGPAAAAPATTAARSRIVRSGQAIDPEILRYRPRVWLSKTESGGASLQEQAEWRLRVARGKADELEYSVLEWRAGKERRLWRPNQLTLVDDAMAGITGDMLIKRTVLTYDERGYTTQLTVTGPEAFDRIEEGERRRRRRDHRHRRTAAAGDSTARPLTADPEPTGRR